MGCLVVGERLARRQLRLAGRTSRWTIDTKVVCATLRRSQATVSARQLRPERMSSRGSASNDFDRTRQHTPPLSTLAAAITPSLVVLPRDSHLGERPVCLRASGSYPQKSDQIPNPHRLNSSGAGFWSGISVGSVLMVVWMRSSQTDQRVVRRLLTCKGLNPVHRYVPEKSSRQPPYDKTRSLLMNGAGAPTTSGHRPVVRAPRGGALQHATNCRWALMPSRIPRLLGWRSP
jgi:hypothetical protein